MDRAGIWQIIIEERLGIRDLLRSLTPGQWDEPSLCDGWRVRDVAAHLIANPQLDVAATLRFVGGMWRGYDTAVRLDGVRRGSAPVEQILDQWGADGWELVQVVPGPEGSTNLVAYLKRPTGEK